MPVKHGVEIVYGKTVFPLSASDLQLMAAALVIINPADDKVVRRARCLSAEFLALSEYAESVKQPPAPSPKQVNKAILVCVDGGIATAVDETVPAGFDVEIIDYDNFREAPEETRACLSATARKFLDENR